ncbi:lipase/acyltransferase domain-containing protein [Acaryochloris marina NIES-2412]|uniref:lipase/acyltransferase domain-containing protein n=1 Tax=Acaryochloris marina TaxID=155978 RepID=UPI004058E103
MTDLSSLIQSQRPLVFIPGLFGSKIEAEKKDKNYRAWPSTAASWTAMLQLDENSEPKEKTWASGIIKDGLIDSFFDDPYFSPSPIYSPLINHLEKNGYTEGDNLFCFPYDFRRDIDDIALRMSPSYEDPNTRFDSLSSFLERLKNDRGFSQVDLICHSMGGVVALKYMLLPVRNVEIGKAVLIGAPVFGSAKLIASLLCGTPPSPTLEYLVGRWGPSYEQWRNIGRFFPSLYQLTPNAEISEEKGPFLAINYVDQNYKQSHGLDNNSLINSDTVISKKLLREAYRWKEKFFDNLRINLYLWESSLYFIQGTGVPTPYKYEVVYNKYPTQPPNIPDKIEWGSPAKVPNDSKQYNADGDGTVINFGLETVLGISSDQIDEFDGKEHLQLAQDQEVLKRATSILLRTFKTIFSVSTVPHDPAVFNSTYRVFAFDYDSNGEPNHLALYVPGGGAMYFLKPEEGTMTVKPGSSTHDPNNQSGLGIGKFDLHSALDRAFAFDYNSKGHLDHIVLYRPVQGAFWVVKNDGGIFTEVFASVTKGVGNFTLKDRHSKAFAFDFMSKGTLDYIFLYAPGIGSISVVKRDAQYFASVFDIPQGGIESFTLDLEQDRAFAFDYKSRGTLDHIVFYRPGRPYGPKRTVGKICIVKFNNYVNEYPEVVFDSEIGIGGYDLTSPNDRAFAFDYLDTGKLDHIVFYRPGSGEIWIMRPGPGNTFETVYKTQATANTYQSGIGKFELSNVLDRGLSFVYNSFNRRGSLVFYTPNTPNLQIIYQE